MSAILACYTCVVQNNSIISQIQPAPSRAQSIQDFPDWSRRGTLWVVWHAEQVEMPCCNLPQDCPQQSCAGSPPHTQVCETVPISYSAEGAAATVAQGLCSNTQTVARRSLQPQQCNAQDCSICCPRFMTNACIASEFSIPTSCPPLQRRRFAWCSSIAPHLFTLAYSQCYGACSWY